MEEKAEMFDGSYEFQEGLYDYCWERATLTSFIKESTKQLTVFISKFGFSDVKYDNIPLDKYGRVSLFDLGEDKPVTGLTAGCGGGEDGILAYLPLDQYDHYANMASDYLTESESNLLKNKKEGMKARIKNKQDKQLPHKNFHIKSGIHTTHDTINPKLPPNFFKDDKMQQFAEFLIAEINANLLMKKLSFLPSSNRKVSFPTVINGPIWKKAKVIWGNLNFQKQFSDINYKKNNETHSILFNILEKLKKENYISDFDASDLDMCVDIKIEL